MPFVLACGIWCAAWLGFAVCVNAPWLKILGVLMALLGARAALNHG